MSKLESDIQKTVAEVVSTPEVPASAGAVKPITEAVMEEVQPRIDFLTNQEPWWQSRIVLGSLIILASRILAHFGWAIPEELHGDILNLVIAFGPYIGVGFWLAGRYLKKPFRWWGLAK